MNYYDIFNGDADGICSLHQLRMENPVESNLVTGVKRDINLLEKIKSVKQCSITVLDISMDSNKDSLRELLNQGNTVLYFDHHYSGDVPESPFLHSRIDTDSKVCTGIIVNRYLKGKYREWAIVAAFGDNLHETALELAKSLDLTETQIQNLKDLGELINYNGYGKEIKDLFYPPNILYKYLHCYSNPFDFYNESKELKYIREGFFSDMENAQSQKPELNNSNGCVYVFPVASWGRRISGVFSNKIAREEPDSAHALLVGQEDGTYLVSVRAPLERPCGADNLCRKFKTGGGRKAAAGINNLEKKDLLKFFDEFQKTFVS